jgi:hypothetical protein
LQKNVACAPREQNCAPREHAIERNIVISHHKTIKIAAKRKKMNKKLGSPRIFSYICPQNCNFVALLDIVGITERYACLTVVKPRKLSHVNPDDSVISPMLCVDCYYYILDYGFS